MKQHDLILNYLRNEGSITPAQAFRELGITKLSTRVGELIRKGIDIRKEMITGLNRYGEKTRYMKYFIA